MPGRLDGSTIVAVVGSPRPRGNTSLLVDVALEELGGRGAAVRKIMLGEYAVAPCLAHAGCAEFDVCPHLDDAGRLFDEVYAADGLIFASPVYYENVTAQLKAFMDRNLFRYYRDQWFRARAVGLLAVTAETGLDDTLAAMKRFVALSTQGEVPVVTATAYADGLGAVATQPESLAAARELGAGLAELLTGAS